MKSCNKVWITVSFCIVTLAVVVSTSSQAAAQAATNEFAYTANFADKTISGFFIDPGTGKATEVPGSPFPSGTGPQSITHSPDGRFVYEVINNEDLGGPCGGPGELLSFSVDPRTGALSQIDDVFLSGVCSTGVSIDPTGKFVYAASSPDNGPKVGIIDGFQTNNGHLTPLPGTPFASPIEAPDGQGPSIEEIAITPDGKVAYVSDPNDATGILIFDRDTQTGALAFRTAFNSGSPFGAIAITPSGKFLIALGGGSFGFPFTGQPGVFEFAIGEHGNLTAVPGSPFPLPHDFGSSVAISPDGNFVAVVGAFSAITGQGISVFRESAQGTLSLVPGSPFGDVLAGAVRFDPTGRFVLVPGSVYKLDFSTGALTKVSGFTPGGSPWGMTAFQTCVAAASSVNICSPENNSTTTSPVHLLAAVNVGNTFTGAWVYVDGAQVFHSDSPYIATNLTMDPGAHSIEVKGWNSSGAVVRASVHVTVSSGGGCTAPTSAGVNICTPANQSSVTSPVHLLAAVKVNGTLTGAWVQVDGVNQFHSDSPSIDTNLTIDAGAHTIEVKAWNSSGAIVRASADVDVSNGGCLSFSVCCPPPSSAGVKICTPTNGSSASNPVHLVAAITVSGTFTGAWVQVDGINKFHSDSAAIDTDLVIPPGTHTIQVKGWNSSGAIVRASTMVPVGP